MGDNEPLIQPTGSLRQRKGGGENGANAGPSDYEYYREKLVAFYKEHNPAKVDTVDSMLAKYPGEEKALYQTVKQKYIVATPIKQDNTMLHILTFMLLVGMLFFMYVVQYGFPESLKNVGMAGMF